MFEICLRDSIHHRTQSHSRWYGLSQQHGDYKYWCIFYERTLCSLAFVRWITRKFRSHKLVQPYISTIMVLIKAVFYIFLFSIKKKNIYKHYRKLSAEFNKLIKTIGHRARLFENWCWTHPHLPTILTLFGHFHSIKYIKCLFYFQYEFVWKPRNTNWFA